MIIWQGGGISNILITHKQNGGVASARNFGIHQVLKYLEDNDCDEKREYLWFVDPDDFLPDRYAISKINNVFDSDPNLSMLIFEYSKKTIHGELSKRKIGRERIYLNGVQGFRELAIGSSIVTGYPWNKVFNLGRIGKENIVFFNENIGLYEDKLWLIELMPKIDSILFIPDVLYQYNYNSESLSNGANEENAYLAYIDFILPLIAREKGLDSIEFQGAAAFIYRKCWYETSRWKRADEIMKKTHLDWLQILYNIIDNNKSKNTPKDIFWLNLINPFLHLYLNIKRK